MASQGAAEWHRAQRDRHHRIKHSGSDRNSDDVVDEGPEQVLFHRRHRLARQRDRGWNAPQIAPHQRDVTGLDGDVRSFWHRYPNVGLSERWSVVDSVANHRHHPPGLLEPADLFHFLLGQHFCHHALDADGFSGGVRG